MHIISVQRLATLIIGVCMALAVLACSLAAHGVTVTVNPAQTFQTIEGWGQSGGDFGGGADPAMGQPTADAVTYQKFDYLIDDLGLTGSRLWEIGERTDGSGYDVNGDCDAIDWNRFDPGPGADVVGKFIRYFQDRVNAKGEPTSFYSSTIYAFLASGSKPWVLHHPGERALEMWANALYWKEHYGVNINYAVMYNEPGYGRNSINAAIMRDTILAAGPRLAAHGLKTKIQFPECVSPDNSWDTVNTLKNDPDLWQYVGRISYHRYGEDNPYRANMRDFGLAHGIPTGQTEMDRSDINALYNDLVEGGVTYWETSFSGNETIDYNPGGTTFIPTNFYWPERQVMHYVRPGAVRIGATSDDQAVTALAFVKNKLVTTVVINGATAQTITLRGVPAGTYGLSQCIANGYPTPKPTPFIELGVQTVGADGVLTIPNVPVRGVTTLYPYAGPNHPPTISIWTANPAYLTPPVSATTLSVSASDPEKEPLTYAWSVVSQPNGANVVLATPTAAVTAVSGCTAVGTYVFNINVSDGVNTTTKKLYLLEGENHPPTFGMSGFRCGAPYGDALELPGKTPVHANIALLAPDKAPGVLLCANIYDRENDPLTGQWSLVSQPAGANVTLMNNTYIYMSYRAIVNGMTVPGDYSFRCDVHDPTHAVSLVVNCTMHPVNTPPTIDAITATPNTLALPANTTQLTAKTSDPEGDLLRHWWVIKSMPAGAKPAFDHQGRATTAVSNLTVPGNYVFTLRCFDDIHMVTKDVTITVNPQ